MRIPNCRRCPSEVPCPARDCRRRTSSDCRRAAQAIQILTTAIRNQDLAPPAFLSSPTRPRSPIFIRFRRTFFLPGCFRHEFHSGLIPKAGIFIFTTPILPAAIYTNVLDGSDLHEEDQTTRSDSWVDVQHPDASLRPQIHVAANVAETPHPQAQNYRGR